MRPVQSFNRNSLLMITIATISNINSVENMEPSTNKLSLKDPGSPTFSSSCNTCIKVIKLSHSWTIHKFSFSTTKTGIKICSTEFPDAETISKDDDASLTTWRLELYPAGDNEEHKNYLALFLRMMSCKLESVEVQFQYSLLNSEQTLIHVGVDLHHTFSMNTGDWGLWNLYKRDNLKALPNDQLIIVCEMSVSLGQLITIPDIPNQFQVPENRLYGNEMASLFHDQKFFDAVVSVSNEEFCVYKGILATRSPVFAAMFKHEFKERGWNRVTITDFKPEVMKEVLVFIYTNKSPNLEVMVTDLLAAADKYDLIGLKSMCEEVLWRGVSMENAIDILMLADLHHAEQLKMQMIKFIKKCGPELIKTERGKQLKRVPDLLLEILEQS